MRLFPVSLDPDPMSDAPWPDEVLELAQERGYEPEPDADYYDIIAGAEDFLEGGAGDYAYDQYRDQDL